MKVNVKFLANIKDAAGTSEDTVDISGSTVNDVIDALVAKYGDRFSQEILQPDGNIKPGIKVFLNRSVVDFGAPLPNTVNEGDTLDIFPPFYGG